MGSILAPKKPKAPSMPTPVRDLTEVAETTVDPDGIAEARRRVARRSNRTGRAALRIPLSNGGVGGTNVGG